MDKELWVDVYLDYFKTLEEAQKVVEQYKKNNNV